MRSSLNLRGKIVGTPATTSRKYPGGELRTKQTDKHRALSKAQRVLLRSASNKNPALQLHQDHQQRGNKHNFTIVRDYVLDKPSGSSNPVRSPELRRPQVKNVLDVGF